MARQATSRPGASSSSLAPRRGRRNRPRGTAASTPTSGAKRPTPRSPRSWGGPTFRHTTSIIPTTNSSSCSRPRRPRTGPPCTAPRHTLALRTSPWEPASSTQRRDPRAFTATRRAPRASPPWRRRRMSSTSTSTTSTADWQALARPLSLAQGIRLICPQGATRRTSTFSPAWSGLHTTWTFRSRPTGAPSPPWRAGVSRRRPMAPTTMDSGVCCPRATPRSRTCSDFPKTTRSGRP
mmetsp:Transcript_1600/g.3617  ORF Transcript_1600/g.3617 Transcript_1600/m.3617 type:complete len:237 (+) Transcript_1600:1594-2304(+)